MKTIVKREPITELVTVGMKDVTTYFSDDGRQFPSAGQAQARDKYLERQRTFKERFKLSHVSLTDMTYNVIVVNDLCEETKIELFRNFPGLNPNELTLGVNLLYVDDSGDLQIVNCFALEVKLKSVEEDLKLLNKLKELL